MNIDIIQLLLGGINVCIFLAIFSLLRTMNNPYIQRYEMVCNGKFYAINKAAEYYFIQFQFKNRNFELYQLKRKVKKRDSIKKQDFLYLKASMKSDLVLRFLDLTGKSQSFPDLEGVVGIPRGENFVQVKIPETNELYKEFVILTNHKDKALQFLTKEKVAKILTGLKHRLGVYIFAMPLVLENGAVVLDYHIAENQLRAIVNNPRRMKTHIAALHMLAEIAEKLEQGSV